MTADSRCIGAEQVRLSSMFNDDTTPTMKIRHESYDIASEMSGHSRSIGAEQANYSPKVNCRNYTKAVLDSYIL